MYAVFETGGKQYRAAEGDILKIEKLAGDAGDTIEFDRVLMLGGDSPVLGAPLVKGGKVSAEVVGQGRNRKVHIIKFRRRKHHMKRQGHRQHFTQVKITGISSD
ncbi:MAG TPA: 50S ribosomal protein L21 [Gammaproteobacteria bacterium]|nr:50S ribosomal protein L21 [Gammaproteobacteria bacterium]